MDHSPRTMVWPYAAQSPFLRKIPQTIHGTNLDEETRCSTNFYNLNRLQIRNEAAQATESADEYRKTREIHQSTITALYQQNSTEPDPRALYKQPLGDILNMSNERLVNWLQSHSASSSYRAHQHHDKPPHLTQNLLQQDLHKFIQHETERWNQVLLLTIKSGPGYSINNLFSKEPLE
jgi:hypothetical protein